MPRAALGASLSATKQVAGGLFEGGSITYTVVLTNNGLTTQPDAAGDEMLDVLPAGLTLTGASATAGTAAADPANRRATWNGSLAPGASVTVTIQATIQPGTRGATLSNQALLAWDADGDGANEAAGVTDDPAGAGSGNPTVLTVGSQPLSFYTVPPCRVLDTRTTGPLGNETRPIAVAGVCGIPATAKAIAANVTVVTPNAPGHLTLFPSGVAAPVTSTINFSPGQIRANNAILALGNGGLDLKAALVGGGQVHAILDVSGYFQ